MENEKEEVEYNEGFMDEEIPEVDFSDEESAKIMDAVEDNEIEMSESPDPSENEGLLFMAWCSHCKHKGYDLDESIKAFINAEEGEPESENFSSIEIFSTPETKAQFESDQYFADAYSKQIINLHKRINNER